MLFGVACARGHQPFDLAFPTDRLKHMEFKDYKLTGPAWGVASDDEVDAIEASLGIRFPSRYRDYVTTLGEGALGVFVRIYTPRQILSGANSLSAWRERISQYWFWEPGDTGLTQARALEAFIIGDTIGGDELVVHPDQPERILVLPRNEEVVGVAGVGLRQAVDWLCESGVLAEAFTEREFEPDSAG